MAIHKAPTFFHLTPFPVFFIEFVTVSQHGDRGWNRTEVWFDIDPYITRLDYQPPVDGGNWTYYSTHPAHEKVYHTTGVYAPYSFRTAAWVLFRVPQESEQWNRCETEPMFFRPYPRRLEFITVCRCHNKGSTFSSVILRPWVLVRPGFEPATSRKAYRRLTNWANRAAA